MVKCPYGWHKVRFKYPTEQFFIFLSNTTFCNDDEVEGIKILLNC